jgi:hypothetical protein
MELQKQLPSEIGVGQSATQVTKWYKEGGTPLIVELKVVSSLGIVLLRRHPQPLYHTTAPAQTVQSSTTQFVANHADRVDLTRQHAMSASGMVVKTTA